MRGKASFIAAAALAISMTGMGFTCTVVEDVSFQWAWTIEGRDAASTDFDALCSWAGWGPSTVRLIIDVDHDMNEDFHYDADCAWGSATTDPDQDPADYEEGDVIWFAFQFVANDGSVTAQSAEYVELTVEGGTNDLGTVDFDWEGNFGPLYVEVQWADKEADPVYGGCNGPPNPVETMGYLLSYSTGEIADQVDIDVEPMACTTDLEWTMTEFDTYELVLDGENTGGDYWASTCTDLVVDSISSNDYACEVFMNPTG